MADDDTSSPLSPWLGQQQALDGQARSEIGKLFEDLFKWNERWFFALDRHALVVGHAAISWGRLQTKLALLYVGLLKPEPRKFMAVMDAWGEVKNDRAQRRMVAAVAVHVLAEAKDAALLKEITDAMSQINSQEGSRDDILHAPYDTNYSEVPGVDAIKVVPTEIPGHPRADALRKYGDNLATRLGDFSHDVDLLSEQINSLYLLVVTGERSPLPERPKLRWPSSRLNRVAQRQGPPPT